ncbi:hypothetical protein O0I10_008473 [Lichtheimia ornata]|uniref:Uncharacterized protein n=1 Tax=Lichtheimia ornata TaxID=688661 RepID=A0AAD7UYC1_9FUNG|nr:uncharacterized protein O0I10_008473 [Lichtheimia ornata]KAJ8655809.1 hypothetical protein O0I10_008473 [Lichtheimia ornata]
MSALEGDAVINPSSAVDLFKPSKQVTSTRSPPKLLRGMAMHKAMQHVYGLPSPSSTTTTAASSASTSSTSSASSASSASLASSSLASSSLASSSSSALAPSSSSASASLSSASSSSSSLDELCEALEKLDIYEPDTDVPDAPPGTPEHLREIVENEDAGASEQAQVVEDMQDTVMASPSPSPPSLPLPLPPPPPQEPPLLYTQVMPQPITIHPEATPEVVVAAVVAAAASSAPAASAIPVASSTENKWDPTTPTFKTATITTKATTINMTITATSITAKATSITTKATSITTKATSINTAITTTNTTRIHILGHETRGWTEFAPPSSLLEDDDTLAEIWGTDFLGTSDVAVFDEDAYLSIAMRPLFITLVADDKTINLARVSSLYGGGADADDKTIIWPKSSLHFIGGEVDADDKTINLARVLLLNLFMNQSILGCNSHEHNLAAIILTKEHHTKQSHGCNERHDFGRGIIIGGALCRKQSSQASSNYHSYQATSDMGPPPCQESNPIIQQNQKQMQYHKKSTSAKKKAAAISYLQQRSSIFLRQSKFNHTEKGSLNGADLNIIVM